MIALLYGLQCQSKILFLRDCWMLNYGRLRELVFFKVPLS
jgi:hypothetical protein